MRNRMLLALFAIMFAGVTVFAQGLTKATVNGTIVDEAGTPLPGVTVILTNLDQGTKRTVVTDASGKYRAPLLPLGKYRMEASLAGFATYTAQNITLKLGDVFPINITLKMESMEETIVVTAESPLIESQKVDVMSSIGENYIENLPVLGRDFKDFVLLTPGVTEADGSRVAGEGTYGIMNNLQIDGASYNSTFFGEQRGSTRIPFTFSQETIKEFNVISNGYSAQYGDAAGMVINAVTKSGSNEFHGGAHWFMTNEGMKADRKANDYITEPQPFDEFDRDQFGFTLSGPIIKDKLWFFFAYDAQREESQLYNEFDRWADDYDAFAAAYPEIIAANEGYWPTTEDNDVYFLKFDWQINDVHRASLRINRQEFEAVNGTSSYLTTGVTGNGLEEDDSTSIVAEVTSILSDNLFNEFRIQWSKEERPRTANFTDHPEVEVRYYDAVFGQNQFLPNWLNEEMLEIIDDITWINGDHTVKAGFRLAQYEYDDNFFRYGGGAFQFYGFDELMDFLENGSDADLYYRTTYTQAFSPIEGTVIYDATEMSFYLEDSWQFNPKLMLYAGVRYQSSSYDDIINPNPELAAMGLQELPEQGDFDPRIALTYDVTGEGTDLIRFGAGIFHHRTASLLVANAMLTNGINVIRIGFNPGDDLFPEDLYDRIDPSELDPENPYPPDVFVFEPDFENPYVFRTSLSYEKKLNENWLAAVDLKYTRGYHFQIKRDINLGIEDDDGDGVQDVDEYGRPLWDSWNRPYDNFRKIMAFNDDGASKSSSVTFRLQKKFADRWSMFASYTFTSAYDITTNERSVSSSSAYVTNPGNVWDDWGRSDYHNKSQFKISWTVLLPWDIKFSGYHRFYSGRPYTALSGDDDNGDYYDNDRAVIDGEVVRRNTFRQPSFDQTDIRFSKTFEFMDRHSIEVLVECFNVLNSANRYTSNTDYSRSYFGTLNNSTYNTRQFQVGVKYRF